MSYPHRTPDSSGDQRDNPAGNSWAFEASDEVGDEAPATLSVGLVNLAFIRAALRRGARIWCATALIGLLLGVGIYVKKPPAAQATATVLMPPATYPGEVLDDQMIAESRAVAANAISRLGLHESPEAFIRTSTITAPTDRLLIINTKAKSSAEAVQAANALANAILSYQANLLRTQDKLVTEGFQQRISQGQQHIDAISKEISQLSAEPASPARQARLTSLRSERTAATTALAVLKQTNIGNQAGMLTNTTATIDGSKIIDPAIQVPPSKLRSRASYAIIGLIVGFILGAGIVIVRALLSDRLRRRDDVARVLGAPVKVSVGKVGTRRSARVSQADVDRPDIRRIAAYLRTALPPRSQGLASLAVVPVDDPGVAALSVVSLANTCAQRGLRIVLADLCPGSPVARLLDVPTSGVHQAQLNDARVVVTAPAEEYVAATGPLKVRSRSGWSDPVDKQLAAACTSADLLLTLAPLDPAIGGEYLSSWANNAVVLVTAGRASAERIQSVGEMVRLAGIEQFSAVLVGADKTDQTIGAGEQVLQPQEQRRPHAAAGSDLPARGGATPEPAPGQVLR